MKILHLITTLDLGGAEKQLVLVTKEQILMGHEVLVIPLKGKNELYEHFVNNGIEVLDFLRNKNLFRQFQLLRRYLKRNNIDILHAHLPQAEIMTFLTSNKRYFISRHNTELFFRNK